MQIDGRLHLESNEPTNEDNKRIKELCNYSLTIADLIVGWLTRSDHSLGLISAPDLGDKYLMISFGKGKESVAMLFCETANEIAQYAGFKPLNRTVQKYADMDEIIPDYDWIEKRDQRLKICWDDENGFCNATPRAFGELILSYVCKKPGLARITKEIAERRHHPYDIYKADLASFEEEKSYGFHEIFATKADAYERFVAGRFEKNSRKLRPYAKRQEKLYSA